MTQKKRGMHSKGEERSGHRPIADLTRLLDPAIISYEITICELQSGLVLDNDELPFL